MRLGNRLQPPAGGDARDLARGGFAVAAGYQLDEETVSLISGPLFHVGATGLGIPTLMAAGAYDLFKNRALLSVGDLPLFLTGGIAAFISAFLCVRWLLRYIATHTFTPFIIYRITLGAGVFVLLTTGLVSGV